MNILPVLKIAGQTLYKEASKTTTIFGGNVNVSPIAKIAAGAVVLFPTQILTAAKSLVPKTLLGKTIAGGALIAGGGYVAKEPVKAFMSIPKTGAALFEAGGLLAEPSGKGALDFIKEHPVFSSVAGAAAALVVTKSVIPATASFFQSKAIQEQTEAMKGVTNRGNIPLETGGQPIPQDNTLPTDTTAIQPQQTQSLSTKKRSKRAKAKRLDGVRQSVRVNVITNNSAHRITKTYLNKIPMYN